MHLPWGQGAGLVITAIIATPDMVLIGFFCKRRRIGWSGSMVCGSRCSISLSGGTVLMPYFLQRMILVLWICSLVCILLVRS